MINNERVKLAVVFPRADGFILEFYHFRGLRVWHHGELCVGDEVLLFSNRGEAVDQAISLGAARVIVSTLSEDSHSFFVRIKGSPFNPRTGQHWIFS